ncbi:MAG: RCC1 domain-containing protein [Microthrixaceae bacterium]
MPSRWTPPTSTPALLDNGGVRCWGRNNNGQLGNGTATSSNRPVAVLGITNAVDVADGSRTHLRHPR